MMTVQTKKIVKSCFIILVLLLCVLYFLFSRTTLKWQYHQSDVRDRSAEFSLVIPYRGIPISVKNSTNKSSSLAGAEVGVVEITPDIYFSPSKPYLGIKSNENVSIGRSSLTGTNCHPKNPKELTTTASRYLIIGGISYPGYIVSKFLKDKGHKFRITEDISSLGFDSGTWTYWDKLREIDLSPSILDYEDKKLLKSQLEWLDGGTIIYIPSLLFNAIHQDSEFDTTYVTIILKTFLNILEAVRLKQLKYKLVLFAPQQGKFMTPFAAAIRLFSLLLHSYSFVHSLNIAFVEFSSEGCTTAKLFHCCGVSQVIEVLPSVLNPSFTVCEDVHLKCFNEVVEDAFLTNSYSNKELYDVITSTFFATETSKYKKNSFQFIKGFYLTAIKQNAQVLIFHNGLGNAFLERVQGISERAKFVKSNLNGRSMNDARFYILYNYLLDNPQIRSIVLQDLRDGTFPGNPFKVMDVIGDLLYVGTDITFYVSGYDHPWMRGLGQKCHPSDDRKDVNHYHPFYNAGTIGGTRDVMLTFLTRLTQYFDKAPHGRNCNMATVCLVTHKHFFDHAYSGYPFEGLTETGLSNPIGMAVRHKRTLFD